MSEAVYLSEIEGALGEAEVVSTARAALRDVGDRAWIVGGAVRDAARGAPVTDLDLAFDGDVEAAARHLAQEADGHPFELSDEFSTWRVVDRSGLWKVDIAALRADTIEGDLRLRDFTINSMAVPLTSGTVLDPTGGLSDLERGVLRVSSPDAFADDPLRVMRAARLGAAGGLDPDPETIRAARQTASRLDQTAGERQFAELVLMVSGSDPLRAVELMSELGVLPAVLPEIEALRGVGQSANHHLDAYEHTIEVLRQMLAIEQDLDHHCGPVSDRVATLLAQPLGEGLTRRDGLRFAALLHDVGKPSTRKERDGWVSFIGHDQVGAEMIRELCGRLRASRKFSGYLEAITRDHLVLGFMVSERPIGPRRVWEYLDRTGAQAVDTTLFTVADRLAATGGAVPEEAITGHLELAQELLTAAVAWEDEGPPEPLMRGDELAAELSIEPSPVLGEATRELQAAQYAGEVEDRAAAVEHLRRWLAGR